MRSGSGLLLVVVGIFVLWVASGKRYQCFAGLSACLTGSTQPSGTPGGTSPATATPGGTSLQSPPALPNLGAQSLLSLLGQKANA